MNVEPIDLHHFQPRIIASYLLETEDGLALFDCGQTTCIPQLEAGLRERGVRLADVRHLLLSHIHLDHAGAAGTLVRSHPHLQVHVSGVDTAITPYDQQTSSSRSTFCMGNAVLRALDELEGQLPTVDAGAQHDRALFAALDGRGGIEPVDGFTADQPGSCAATVLQ